MGRGESEGQDRGRKAGLDTEMTDGTKVIDGRRPRIGVTWVMPGEMVSDNYLEAVRGAGGEPVPLRRDATTWDAQLARVDGLLLSGGADIDPRLYHAERIPSCQAPEPKRDELEWRALQLSLERGRPVLGICRGFQFLNVFFGGTLLQDIPTERPDALLHHRLGDISSYHLVDVLPETVLAAIVGAHDRMRVNSRHHQGVTEAQLAPGLRISARAEDGIVEGLEGTGEGFLLGVQCHPERLEEVPGMVPLFAALVEEARKG